MAVTFHTQPQVFTPASNPVVWSFSSDQTFQTNFSYIVEVYINSILHSTHQVFPQNGIYAKFNASEIMRGILSSPLITDTTFVTLYSSAYDFVNIKVYEQYGATPAIFANATSASKYVFNAALRHQDFVNWDYLDYNILEKGCKHNKKAFILAKKSKKQYKYGHSKTKKILTKY